MEQPGFQCGQVDKHSCMIAKKVKLYPDHTSLDSEYHSCWCEISCAVLGPISFELKLLTKPCL